MRTRSDGQIGCMAVARVIQTYLDGEADAGTARSVGAHLELCRRCGMKAATYRAIKSSLARTGAMDDLTRRRLEEFARHISHDHSGH